MGMEIQTPSAEDGVTEPADLVVIRAYRIAAIGTMHDCILRTLIVGRVAGTLSFDDLATFQHQFASVLIQTNVQRCQPATGS